MSTATNGPVAMDAPATCRVHHEGYTLANGVKVVVIHDPTSTKSTAAMGIRTGTHCDPPELQGLAHLCEHMLFLGTEEYPEEGEYNRFVSQNGGHSNAWTEDGSTQYYFTCSNDAFEEALKMFSCFFVTPLFTAESLEREVEAVHSEDEKNHSVDYWVGAEIEKLHLASKLHPASRYGNGNKVTLWEEPRAAGIDVRARLLAFYKEYYVAENACVTVYTPKPAKTVLEVLEPILSKMPRGSGVPTRMDFGTAPFVVSKDAALIEKGNAIAPGTWVQIKANRALQSLKVTFPIPFSHDLYVTKPAAYASHVIGHECTGSLLAVLKGDGLAESLSAGAGHGVDDAYDNFDIVVGLTAKGVREVDTVVRIIFEAIEHMRRDGVVESVANEMVACYDVAFNLAEVSGVEQHCAVCSRHANRYGLKRCLSGAYRVFERDDIASAKVFEYLVPSNAYFILRLQDVDGAIDAAAEDTQTEGLRLPTERFPVTATKTIKRSKHHSGCFGVATIAEDLLASWSPKQGQALHPGLQTAAPNPYVATDFEVAPLVDSKYPTTTTTPRGVLHVKRDSRFSVPKGFFAVQLQSPVAYESALSRFFTRVAKSILRHVQTERLYFADLGAMHCSMTAATRGLELEFNGARQKLLEFAEHVLKAAVDPATYMADEQAYQNYAKLEIRSLLAEYVGQPYIQASSIAQSHTRKQRFSFVAILNAAIGEHDPSRDDLSSTATPPPFAKFVEFIPRFLERLRFDALWLGNSKEDQTNACAAVLERVMAASAQCSEADLADDRLMLQLPSRGDMVTTPRTAKDDEAPLFGVLHHERAKNLKDPNHAVHITFQCGVFEPEPRVLADTVSGLISSLFFDTMRTTETLGYVVGTSSRVVGDTVAIIFVAQSANFDAQYLFTRIYAFLDALPAYLEALPQEQYDTVVAAEIQTRLDAPKSIADEGTTHYARRDNVNGFGYKELEIEYLKKNVTKEAVVEFAKTWLSNDAMDARCLVTALFGDDASLEAMNHQAVDAGDHGRDDMQHMRVQLLPKRTPETGKEQIALKDFKGEAEQALTLCYLKNRFGAREAWPTWPSPKPSTGAH